jgi:SAM-dependent methyltransferase
MNFLSYFNNNHTLWLKILILFAVLFLVVSVFKSLQRKTEGFQNEDTLGFGTTDKYILKRNQDIYDDFYAQLYREVIEPPSRLEQEINTIQQMTQPSKEASVFLDIGAGSGNIMNELSNRGFINVFGIEASQSWAEKSPMSDNILVGDVLDRSQFEQNTFTHITCLGNQIYDTDKKVAFFKNCYYWLKPGGYLIMHLIEKIRPNTTKPIKEEKVKGIDYKMMIEPGESNSSVILTEQMTNMETGQQRINEKTLFVKEIGDIINDALYAGFIIVGKSSITGTMAIGNKEYLYFFQK